MPDDSFPGPDPFARMSMKTTVGEILDDGTVTDLVELDRKLVLAHSDGIQHDVEPQFLYGNIIYAPPQLDPSLHDALTFPPPPVEYGALPVLFDQIGGAFEQRGFSRELAYSCALIGLATWVPELFVSPVTAVMHGSDMRQAAILSKLLACVCRRPFLTPRLDRSLPFSLQPTFLVLTGYTSAKESAFWRAANIHGVHVPSRLGVVESLACSKVLFTDDEQSLAAWGPDVFRVPLFSCASVAAPTEQELTEMRHLLQPRCLCFRLRRLAASKKLDKVAPQAQKQSANYDVSRQLLALVENDLRIMTAVAPLLEAQRQEFEESRQRDPYRAIIESLWGPAHNTKEVTVAEVTKRTNAILLSRGENIELDERVVGWNLRRLQVSRGRNGKGKLVRFSADVRRQVHELARRFQLELPKFTRCVYCKRK